MWYLNFKLVVNWPTNRQTLSFIELLSQLKIRRPNVWSTVFLRDKLSRMNSRQQCQPAPVSEDIGDSDISVKHIWVQRLHGNMVPRFLVIIPPWFVLCMYGGVRPLSQNLVCSIYTVLLIFVQIGKDGTSHMLREAFQTKKRGNLGVYQRLTK